MTDERNRRASELFDAVLDLPAADRAGFLAAQCAGDTGLRETVEALLRADEACARSPFLQTPLPQAAAAMFGDFSDLNLVGQVVGGYRLSGVVGAGGMGIVFRADSVDGARETPVAVKLIRHGLFVPGILHRFQREGQLLAQLHHPNIATLHDAGVSDSGVPYLVMEYVDGRPIDAYCDAEQLPVAERVRLMRDVCAAVQHAHQHLIVHRDIKPANILVTGSGAVKLLDFGVAKLLDEDLTPRDATRTAATYRMMTPQYAGPEVVRGEPITTAVDVYGLGLVLYELLAGRRPYEVPKFTPREAERIICEVEPRPPSSVIPSVRPGRAAVRDGLSSRSLRRWSPGNDRLESRSHTRGTHTRGTHTRGTDTSATHASGSSEEAKIFDARRASPVELHSALKGDLDNVVLKALRKDPHRRYASAEQLSQDLERYLGGFPVLAHGDSFGYRARKFLRRHRVSVTAAALCLGLLILGIAGTTWGLVLARRESKRAILEADRARREAIKADRVNVFLQEMLGAADPEVVGADVRVRDVVDRAARRLEADPGDDDFVRATAEGTIGQTYLSLGLLEDAERHLRSALALRPVDVEEYGTERAKILGNLSRVLRLRGNHSEAERAAQEAVELDRKLLGPRHARVARDLAALGTVYQDQGDFTRAEPPYREAVAMLRESADKDGADLAQTLGEFGVLLAQRGQTVEGERLAREGLQLSERWFPADHVRVSTSLRRLAIVLQLAHSFSESEALYRRALAIDRRVLGPRHPNVAQILSNLGPVLGAQGRREEAIAVLRESLEIRRTLFGHDHLTIAATLNNLATVLDAEAAEPLLRESLAISQKLFGNDDYRVGNAYQNLAASLKDRGRYDEAEPLFREALRILRGAFGDEHSKTTFPLLGLGEVLLRTGRYQPAEEYLRQVHDARRRLLPIGDSDRLMSAGLLAECLSGQSRDTEAESILREAVDGAMEKGTLASAEGQASLTRLVRIYDSLKRPADAAAYRKLIRNTPEPDAAQP